jgi:signal transduction histidine kinase
MPQFGQAIKELVTNAVIHNDSRSPEVTVTVTQTDETVRIAVADSGPRIPEMERDLLADQAEQTPLYHGSGLGLWLVKLITARSGGTITVEENSPAGNIVRIELSR